MVTNRQVEDAAIIHVLRLERNAGRDAVDARRRGSLVDIEGDRLIEVKAYGGTARGSALWLEPNQVQAALAEPTRFHLIIVDNVNQGDPDRFRVLDLHGQALAELLARRREKHYFEVPLPTGTYDELVADSPAGPPSRLDELAAEGRVTPASRPKRVAPDPLPTAGTVSDLIGEQRR